MEILRKNGTNHNWSIPHTISVKILREDIYDNDKTERG